MAILPDTQPKFYGNFRKIAGIITKLSFYFIGIAALIWFIVRVVPKPSRASYPCQRASFPIASAFVIWVTGILISNSIFRRAKIAFRKNSNPKALAFLILASVIFIFSVFIIQINESVANAVSFRSIQIEGKKLYSAEIAGITKSIITPEATVAIVKSEKATASEITFEDIDQMIRQAVELAGGFDTLIHEGDVVVLKPNVIAGRAQNDSYSNAFPDEANGIATDYRIIQVVVNMVRERNSTGKIVMLEGSGYGLTRNNMDAIGYNNITGLDSIIYLDENITQWYNTSSSSLVKVSLPEGDNLYSETNEYYLNRVYYEADVLISLPCLKSHFLTGITGSIKNVGIGATPVEMYGNGTGVSQDDLPGRWNHINHGDFATQTTKLDQWIHDFYLCRPVNYVIMDGLQGADYGPYPDGRTLESVQKNLRVILAGNDPLAVDAIEALIAGFDPYLIGHLVYLGNNDIGCINPAFIKVMGTQVHEIKTSFGENMPGRQHKYSDFNAPQYDTLHSVTIDNTGITILLTPDPEVVKVEVAYDDTILYDIVVNDFANIVFPFTTSDGDANKVKVLLYDKYLNCSELSMEHPNSLNPRSEVRESFNIHPNPANELFHFTLPEVLSGSWDIALYTSDGSMVLHDNIKGSEEQQLDISKLLPGTYLIHLASEDRIYQSRLVKAD